MQYPEKLFALSLCKNVLIGISGNEVRVILKGRNVSEPLVFLVAVENLYDKLLEAHIQTGHEAKKMFFFLKTNFQFLLLEFLILTSRYLSRPLIKGP